MGEMVHDKDEKETRWELKHLETGRIYTFPFLYLTEHGRMKHITEQMKYLYGIKK